MLCIVSEMGIFLHFKISLCFYIIKLHSICNLQRCAKIFLYKTMLEIGVWNKLSI
jgi:hypothetical protein